MLDPEWLAKLRYEIFQIGEVIGETFLVAYGIKKGFRKLWPRRPRANFRKPLTMVK